MIYKVFYQETKDRNPKREMTRSLYLEVDSKDERQGKILARTLIEEKHPEYNIELIQALSDKHLAYEKETGSFQLTEF